MAIAAVDRIGAAIVEAAFSLEAESMQVEIEVLHMRRHEKNFLLRGEQVWADKALEHYDRAVALLRDVEAKETAVRERCVLALAAMADYRRAFVKLVDNWEGGRAAEEMSQFVMAARDVEPILDGLLAYFEENLAEAPERARTIFLFVELGALLLVTLFLGVVILTITRPLQTLRGWSRRVAAGDLGAEVDEALPTEFDDLRQDVSSMVQSLRSLILLARNKEQLAVDEARRARKAEEVAVAASQTKTAFLSSVSHELKTPLTAILGYAKLVDGRLKKKLLPAMEADCPSVWRDMGRVMDNLSVVVSEAERLSILLSNVLDLTDLETDRFDWEIGPVAAGDVLRDAAASTNGFAKTQGRELLLDIPPDLPPMAGDRGQVAKVVRNLLDNALKFAETGPVRCQAALVNDQVEISVSDSGPGVPPEDRERVFEKFTQLGDPLVDKAQGLGIGLAICRFIVERHGGAIRVESASDQGARFVFSIPAFREEAHSRSE